ncbi:MAG: hypothetical protein RR384_00135 [Acidaminococcaceae bacterium]
MKAKWQAFAGALVCGALLLSFAPPAEAEPITSVSVELQDRTGRSGKELLARMSASMRVVTEQLLLAHDTGQISVAQKDYTRLLGEVGDRVLTGYQVDSLNLRLGAATTVTIAVSPWSETVEDVQVDLQFSGIDGKMSTVLLQQVPELTTMIKGIVQGASLDAIDWAGGVLRQQVHAELAQRLPEFKAAVEMTRSGKQVSVQVIIYPIGQTIKNVQFELLSETVPNILFIEAKERLRQQVDEIRGLPLQYALTHQQALEQRLLDSVWQEKVVGVYDLTPTVQITPGPDALVTIRLEANKYKLWFEGYGDLGRSKNNISGRAHFGKYISQSYEFFTEVSLVVDGMQWEIAPGLAKRWGKSTLSYARRISDSENDYRLDYDLSPKWHLRAEHFTGSGTTEFGVRYRIHEFLSAEYVYSNDKPYLRLVGNL